MYVRKEIGAKFKDFCICETFVCRENEIYEAVCHSMAYMEDDHYSEFYILKILFNI